MGNDSDSIGLEFVHSKQILKGLNQLRERRELCDVELQAGNSKVSAHRVVLSACSAYFKAMFTGNLMESKTDVIYLKEVDESALNILVDFAYTGKASVTSENVQVLLPAANMLELQKLKDVCCQFLSQQLHPSNCVGICKFAESYSCAHLLKKSRQYMEDHFQEVIKQEEFFLLPPCQLIDLLRNDNLNVVSEQVVFEAVVSWVKYSIADRASQLANLLRFVRLYLLNIRYLTTCFESNDLVRKDRTSQILLNEALKYRLKPTKPVTLEMANPRRAPKRIYAIGGKNGLFATLNSVEFYQPDSDRWVEVAAMNLRRFEFGAAVLEGKLYAVGGLVCGIGTHACTTFRYCDNGMECYDPATNQWSFSSSMMHSRSNHSVQALGGKLYALGGYDGNSYLNTVECYDPKSKEWMELAPMHFSRSCFATVVADGYLYALGGYGPSYLSTVERYDPGSDSWEMVPAMSYCRINFGVGVVSGCLYVVVDEAIYIYGTNPPWSSSLLDYVSGGHNGVSHLRSVECFNPITNEWTIVAPMSRPRTGLSVAVLNGLLYAMGGHDGSGYLSLVQCHDPVTNSWFNAKNMGSSRCSFGIATM